MGTKIIKSAKSKLKVSLSLILMFLFSVFTILPAMAHYDSYDGPVIKGAGRRDSISF